MTPELLRAATGCTAVRAAQLAPALDEACATYGIDTPPRLAAFLAQISHETMGLHYMAEVWGPTPAQRRYEGRLDLGNTQPGDGLRFKGHGLIQVTGRSNHRKATERLRARLGPAVPDFEAQPELLEQPRWAALSAADYWDAHICNAHADAGDFEAITKAINGGLNGQTDRLQRWERAKAALATATPAAPAASPAPQPEPPMIPVLPSLASFGVDLVMNLGRNLIGALTPLAAEKIQAEIGRHTDDPQVAQQITTAVVEAAMAATGKTDPIEAVAAAKADPVAMAEVEQSALDRLASMAPLLDKLAALDREQFADEEASRESAARRAAAEPRDIGFMLAVIVLAIVCVLILLVGAIATVQIVKAGKADTEVWALLVALATWAMNRAGSLYDYRYGSSRGSSTKDIVIGELSKGKTRNPAA